MPLKRAATSGSEAKRQKLKCRSEQSLTAQDVLPNSHNEPVQASQEGMSSGDFPSSPTALEEMIVKLLVKDVMSLSGTCKFFRQTVDQSTHFQELREANLLQRLLRLEDDDATKQLRDSFLAENNSTATYKFSFQTKIDKVHALLGAYEGFFTHYLEACEQFKNSGYTQWPADADFDADVAAIEDAATGIPHQDNALDILKATVRLLKTFSDMRQDGNVDWGRLGALAIAGDEESPGIGLAQKLSGNKVIDWYFHGAPMVEEAARDTYGVGNRLSELGSSFCLLVADGARWGAVMWGVDAGVPSIDAVEDSLSLIKALTNFSRDLLTFPQKNGHPTKPLELPL